MAHFPSLRGFLNAHACNKDRSIQKNTGFYSREVDSAKANERIYDEVKDGHKEKNHQSIQHLDDREGKARL